VVVKINASGNVVDRYGYEPCGAGVDLETAGGLGLTGNIGDPSTGLSRMQQWHMDSLVRAFMSMDPEMAYGKAVVQLNRPIASA